MMEKKANIMQRSHEEGVPNTNWKRNSQDKPGEEQATQHQTRKILEKTDSRRQGQGKRREVGKTHALTKS